MLESLHYHFLNRRLNIPIVMTLERSELSKQTLLGSQLLEKVVIFQMEALLKLMNKMRLNY